MARLSGQEHPQGKEVLLKCMHCREELTQAPYFTKARHGKQSKALSWFHARTRRFTCAEIRSNYTGKGWPLAVPKMNGSESRARGR